MGEIGTTIEGFFTDLEGLLMLISGSLAVIGVIAVLGVIFLVIAVVVLGGSDARADSDAPAPSSVNRLMMIFLPIKTTLKIF